MTKENRKLLLNIYDALTGISSEMGHEFFDAYYKNGGQKLFEDFEKVLQAEGVKFVKPEYEVREVPDHGWGIYDKTTNALVLCGLPTENDAIAVMDQFLKENN